MATLHHVTIAAVRHATINILHYVWCMITNPDSELQFFHSAGKAIAVDATSLATTNSICTPVWFTFETQ